MALVNAAQEEKPLVGRSGETGRRTRPEVQPSKPHSLFLPIYWSQGFRTRDNDMQIQSEMDLRASPCDAATIPPLQRPFYTLGASSDPAH